MPTRQELYDRIRSSSRDEVILEEMIRLGFWPRDGELPADPADEIRRRGELQRQLRALTTENSRLQNVEAIKRAQRKQRMEESRRKRQETKERRLRERQQRAEEWQYRKQREILYLGEDVSGGLSQRQSDQEKLHRLDLPVLNSPGELALRMGVSVGELRFLAFSRRTSPTTHYVRFAIRKKTGGLRHISAPMPRLKRAQEWILENVLGRVELHDAAHGFRRQRSIVTNAAPHVGADVVINMDIEEFFPTITYPRIKGVFQKLGYSESVATVLALLCSEPETSEVKLDGKRYFVGRGPRFLPQGAPTSPALTNIICRGLDARLSGAANKLGFRYTRYADDITFSGVGVSQESVGRALRQISHIVADEGFRPHPKKTRVLRKGRRREVTGLTVEQRVNVSRKLLRRFRAVLFQIERDGPAGKRWGQSDDVMASIEGFANFVAMVDEGRGAELKQRVARIIDKHGRGQYAYAQRNRWRPRTADQEAAVEAEFVAETHPPSRHEPRAAKTPKSKPWWKFW